MSSGGETEEELEFFIEQFQIEYPVLLDAWDTYARYNQPGGSSPYPLDYIIDAQGKVAYFKKEYDPDGMAAVIDSLLGKEPEIRVEPTALDFGPVALGDSVETLITVFNDGDGDLHVFSVESSHADFDPNILQMVLTPGSSQALLVRYAPSELGPLNAQLILLSDDGDEDELVVTLYGEGVSETGVDPPGHAFWLGQNSPNPFTVETGIRFSLPGASSARLTFYDVRGRKVRRLEGEEELGGGVHGLLWDGRDDRGRELPSGVYFYKLEAGGRERTRKAILVR